VPEEVPSRAPSRAHPLLTEAEALRHRTLARRLPIRRDETQGRPRRAAERRRAPRSTKDLEEDACFGLASRADPTSIYLPVPVDANQNIYVRLVTATNFEVSPRTS